MDTGGAGGLLDLVVGGVAAAEAEVVAQGAGEEERLLEHDADLRAHPGARERGEFAAVEADGALLVVVEAQEQVHERALAGA